MAGERNDCRISLRFTKAEIELIDRAARSLGQSRSEFIREAALKAAEKVLSGASSSMNEPKPGATMRAHDAVHFQELATADDIALIELAFPPGEERPEFDVPRFWSNAKLCDPDTIIALLLA